MTSITVTDIFTRQYTLDLLRDEAIQLVQQGVISRQQPIFCLCNYFPAREWPYIEAELERHSYLLRDRIIDLIGSERWEED